MDDLFNKAIVLVYPDGYVDPVPIKEDCYNHVTYWYEYLKTSPRFQKIVKDNSFKFDWVNEYNTKPILELLVQNGVIVFTNTEVYYICNNLENAEVLYGFIITLPSNYEEHQGLVAAKKEIEKLDSNRYKIDVFRTELDDFGEFDSEEYEKFLKNNKQNEEEKKL